MNLPLAVLTIDEVLVAMDGAVPGVGAYHLRKVRNIAFQFLAATICRVRGGDVEHERKLLHNSVVSSPFPGVQDCSEFSHIDAVFDDVG